MSEERITALVTGSSRGIGSALALRLGMAGMRVGVTARTLDPHPRVPGTIRDTVKAIEDAGGEAVPLVADVNSADDRARLMDAAHEALGSIDILINNAGVLFGESVVTLSEKRLQLMYEVLVHAPLLAHNATLLVHNATLLVHDVVANPREWEAMEFADSCFPGEV